MRGLNQPEFYEVTSIKKCSYRLGIKVTKNYDSQCCKQMERLEKFFQNVIFYLSL